MSSKERLLTLASYYINGTKRFSTPVLVHRFPVLEIKVYFVHLPGAKTPKMVHPAMYSCVANYINLFKI